MDDATIIAALRARLDDATRLLKEGASLIDEALTTHIYDEDNGDEIPDDCPYVEHSEAVDKFLAGAPVPPEKIRIGVTMEGGLVRDVFSDKPCPQVEVVVIDYDVEGTQGDELVGTVEIRQDLGEWARAIFSPRAVIVAEWPETRPATAADPEGALAVTAAFSDALLAEHKAACALAGYRVEAGFGGDADEFAAFGPDGQEVGAQAGDGSAGDRFETADAAWAAAYSDLRENGDD